MVNRKRFIKMNIYLIIQEKGEYEDFRYEPIIAFTNKEAANAYCNKLNKESKPTLGYLPIYKIEEIGLTKSANLNP